MRTSCQIDSQLWISSPSSMRREANSISTRRRNPNQRQLLTMGCQYESQWLWPMKRSPDQVHHPPNHIWLPFHPTRVQKPWHWRRNDLWRRDQSLLELKLPSLSRFLANQLANQPWYPLGRPPHLLQLSRTDQYIDSQSARNALQANLVSLKSTTNGWTPCPQNEEVTSIVLNSTTYQPHQHPLVLH